MKDARRRLDAVEVQIEKKTAVEDFDSWSDEEILAELEGIVYDWREGRLSLLPAHEKDDDGPDGQYSHLSDDELLESIREEKKDLWAPSFEHCETCESRTPHTYDRKLCLACGAAPKLESEIRHWEEQLEGNLARERRLRIEGYLERAQRKLASGRARIEAENPDNSLPNGRSESQQGKGEGTKDHIDSEANSRDQDKEEK